MRVVAARGFYSAIGVLRLKNMTPKDLLEKILRKYNNVQFIDPEALLDWDVFDAAFINAVLVYGAGKQKAKTLANELLLRLAATTQLDEAIKRVGLKDGLKHVVYFTVGNNMDGVVELAKKVVELANGDPLDDLNIPDEDKLKKIIKLYGINERQLNAVQAETRFKAVKLLVLQKIASTMF